MLGVEAIEEGEIATKPSSSTHVSLERKSMGTFNLGGPKFEIEKFNDCIDYLLWER